MTEHRPEGEALSKRVCDRTFAVEARDMVSSIPDVDQYLEFIVANSHINMLKWNQHLRE